MSKAENFLISEYEYLAQNAFNANEDRVKVFNYYLAAVGTLIASGLVFELNTTREIAILGYIFIVLGSLGVVSLLTLLRLRNAWLEAVLAMNQLKQYYISKVKEKNLESAFRWNGATIPNVKKIYSVAFLTAITISVVSSVSFSIGFTLLLETQFDSVSLVVSFGIFVLSFALEKLLWFIG